jgi:hypothetical protein
MVEITPTKPVLVGFNCLGSEQSSDPGMNSFRLVGGKTSSRVNEGMGQSAHL